MNAVKIAEVCGGTIYGNREAHVTGVCTDTRKNFTQSLYTALAGERFDGHDYIEKAVLGGSSAVLWCENDRTEEINNLSVKYPECAFIKVENTLKALGAVSGEFLRNYREKKENETGKKMPVAAITGSVGKTTTKEMTALALSALYDVCKSEGNHNNEIGVPMTILSLKNENALVTEFGMRGMGQIEYLTGIVKPTIGIITNIGTAHLELLGSRSRIFMAKAEIVSGMDDGGILVVNGDNDYLENKDLLDAYITKVFNKKINIFSVGTAQNCDFRITDINETEGQTAFYIEEKDGHSEKITLKTVGTHNVTDAGLAYAAAVLLGADRKRVGEKLSEYGSDSLRQKISEINGVKIIDDTYNANPESMKAALSVLGKSQGRKIAVLGSMLELGEKSDDFHMQIGEFAAENADILITAGKEAEFIAKGFNKSGKKCDAVVTENSSAAGEELVKIIKTGDTVLVKGSRGMLMERAVKIISGVEK